MIDELYIWEKIFNEDDYNIIYFLLGLIIMNDDAKEYVYDQIIEYKKRY